MPDQVAFVPIVDGETNAVNGLYLQTTQGVSTGILPIIQLWNAGSLVASSNGLPVADAALLLNTGSILTGVSGILAQESIVAANGGSIVAQNGSMIAQNGSMIAQLGSIVTKLSGTVSTTPAITPVSLDTATVATGGTAVNALTAGHAAKGGLLNNPNNYPIYYSQMGAASTTPGGDTYYLAPGATATLFPSANAVSVNAGTNGAIISGNGFT